MDNKNNTMDKMNTRKDCNACGKKECQMCCIEKKKVIIIAVLAIILIIGYFIF